MKGRRCLSSAWGFRNTENKSLFWGSKQTAATKAPLKTNKHYGSDNPLYVFATQAQASTRTNQDRLRGKENVSCILCFAQEPGSRPSYPA